MYVYARIIFHSQTVLKASLSTSLFLHIMFASRALETDTGLQRTEAHSLILSARGRPSEIRAKAKRRGEGKEHAHDAQRGRRRGSAERRGTKPETQREKDRGKKAEEKLSTLVGTFCLVSM